MNTSVVNGNVILTSFKSSFLAYLDCVWVDFITLYQQSYE